MVWRPRAPHTPGPGPSTTLTCRWQSRAVDGTAAGCHSMGDLGSSPPPAFVPSRADSVPAKGSACMLQAEDDPKGSVLKTVVGSTVETREEHTQRCTTPSCPRCRWCARGQVWQAAYGTIETRAGPREKRVWLTERLARWNGALALGVQPLRGRIGKANPRGTSRPSPRPPGSRSMPANQLLLVQVRG